MNYARSTSLSNRAGQPIAARAFTLIEMVVVLGIIGILAALTLPSFTKAGKGNITEAATRQLMDDLAYARLKAMSGRVRVHVVFFPPQSFCLNSYFHPASTPPYPPWWPSTPAWPPTNTYANLTSYMLSAAPAGASLGGQMSSYAMFVRRSIGEQPGQETPRYLTEWHTLPDGAFIAREAFTNYANVSSRAFWNVNLYLGVNNLATDYWFPLDDVGGTNFLNPFPFIAFDPDGRVYGRSTDLVIPIVQGSLFAAKDSTGNTNLLVDVEPAVTAPPVPSGGIVAGVEYYVSGGGTVRYPPGGPVYRPGDFFTGTPGNLNYTTTGAPRVTHLYGVRVSWVTGRAKAIKPELR